jgi:DNA topoisomerase-3
VDGRPVALARLRDLGDILSPFGVRLGVSLNNERVRERLDSDSLKARLLAERFPRSIESTVKVKIPLSQFLRPGLGLDLRDLVAPFDFSAATPLVAVCPVCAKKGRKGAIYETPDNYICNVAAADPKACNAKLPKLLCQKAITPDNAVLFFTEGKTALIEGMISKRGRPFKSFLVCNAGDKRLLGWEFPPREAKPKAEGAAAAPKRKSRFGKKDEA